MAEDVDPWRSRTSMQLAGWIPHGPQNVCRSSKCYNRCIYVTLPITSSIPFCEPCRTKLHSSRLRAEIAVASMRRQKRLRILFTKTAALSMVTETLLEFLAWDIGEWPAGRFNELEQQALLRSICSQWCFHVPLSTQAKSASISIGTVGMDPDEAGAA